MEWEHRLKAGLPFIMKQLKEILITVYVTSAIAITVWSLSTFWYNKRPAWFRAIGIGTGITVIGTLLLVLTLNACQH